MNAAAKRRGSRVCVSLSFSNVVHSLANTRLAAALWPGTAVTASVDNARVLRHFINPRSQRQGHVYFSVRCHSGGRVLPRRKS